MAEFIVASSRSWNRQIFDKISCKEPGRWLYVSTQRELSDSLAVTLPRYIFFLHWNWLVPPDIWQQHECVCFHMTDVPYGRGGSPLQNLIMNGRAETKVTALRMVREMDSGPVYAKRAMSLDGRALEIYLRAGELSWEMIRWIIMNQPKPIPQEGEPTYFQRRKPEQSVLPDNGDMRAAFDHIRMLDAPGYPSAFVEHGGFRLEFTKAEMKGDQVTAKVVITKRSENE